MRNKSSYIAIATATLDRDKGHFPGLRITALVTRLKSLVKNDEDET
jgi:hypothetical protein